ncbi:protein DnrP [Pseudomonas corrugata]|uniref:Protein DnrP n=1 Tax=Pseudomonas corrugata TaxID=47879 RepID=A0A3M3EJC0_9PSED|nr:hypothetical protein [Pseudomonas corrugata]RMM49718.1 hypothetical protein ALQ77_03238 [Pseudomonas corrugata]SDU91704.1 hypothetical protein SAMN04490183_1566 [Pseudomonas corrugata]
MSAQATCLYCQQASPANEPECRQCGMPLPDSTALAAERRLRRFTWFCVGLTIFCIVMFFWLPRDML